MARINKAEWLSEFDQRFEEALVTFEVLEDKTEVEFVIKIDKEALEGVHKRRDKEWTNNILGTVVEPMAQWGKQNNVEIKNNYEGSEQNARLKSESSEEPITEPCKSYSSRKVNVENQDEEPVAVYVPDEEPVDEERIEEKCEELMESGVINNYDYGVEDGTIDLEVSKDDEEEHWITHTYKEFEAKYLIPVVISS